MADWDRNAAWNRDVLEHIAALLFSLASLAELAADLPFRHRRQVLGILSHGEAEAWAFVMGISIGLVPADAPETADDAARLAASFRALALALCVLLARRFALPGATGARGRWQRLALPACLQVAQSAPDSS